MKTVEEINKINKNLKISPGVVLTERTEPVILKLDSYFNFPALVTSVLRYPESQLGIIRKYLISKGLNKAYPETFNKGVNDKIHHDKYGDIYAWQLGWSKLLNIGVIVNPPIQAACLMDYIRNGVNKKGQVINGSPHFKGGSIDLGGGANGINDEIEAVKKAIAGGVKIISYLPERENNCLHLDVE